MLRLLPAALLALAVAAGCASQPPRLTPDGEQVRVLESRAEAGDCTPVAEFLVSASDLRGDVEAQRLIKARNEAAVRGANAVLQGEAPTGILLLAKREYEAFRCPQ